MRDCNVRACGVIREPPRANDEDEGGALDRMVVLSVWSEGRRMGSGFGGAGAGGVSEEGMGSGTGPPLDSV